MAFLFWADANLDWRKVKNKKMMSAAKASTSLSYRPRIAEGNPGTNLVRSEANSIGERSKNEKAKRAAKASTSLSYRSPGSPREAINLPEAEGTNT